MEYVSLLILSFIIVLLFVALWQHLRKNAKQMEDLYAKLDLSRCDKCGSADCQAYTFFELKFFGIPVACIYRVVTSAHSLCPEHARASSFDACLSTGLKGHWGFPGCIAGIWYVMRNLVSLAKAGSLTLSNALTSVAVGILLGWVLVLGSIFVAFGGLGLFFVILDKLLKK